MDGAMILALSSSTKKISSVQFSSPYQLPKARVWHANADYSPTPHHDISCFKPKICTSHY